MDYNGFKSWNAWNVSLWLNNDETSYRHAKSLVDKFGRKKAARFITEYYGDSKTPDGAKYNYSSIYSALEGM